MTVLNFPLNHYEIVTSELAQDIVDMIELRAVDGKVRYSVILGALIAVLEIVITDSVVPEERNLAIDTMLHAINQLALDTRITDA